MAVNYVARKCTQCAGKLQYIKEKKIWKCLYCGAEIEREEQYDGLFTIKNVVRQSLLDTAYRRLDSAEKNLIECEKIDSRYVGTLIAKIAYEMIKVTTPGACDERDIRSVFTQLKKNYDQLRNISTTITDDEEVLYEFLGESDIFATLILVYDSLNDMARRDYVAQLLEAGEVYSKPANTNLLTYALKNSKLELADSVISNTNNIDVKTALGEVLSRYPDGASKAENIAKLFSTGVIKYEDKALIEDYLYETQDSAQTKGKAVISAIVSGIQVRSELVMDRVVRQADSQTVKDVLNAFCGNKLSDEDVVKILDFAYDCGDSETALNAMDCLKNSGQYVYVPAKLLVTMLSIKKYTAKDKVLLIDKTFEFKVENKSLETVITNYLCYNSDSADDRKKIINCLFEKTDTFPTSTVESYILNCTADGENKAAIVSAMFDKGLNVSFFNDLLSKYMKNGSDSKEVKAEIIDILSQRGLRIDPDSMIDYICSSSDEAHVKIQFVKKMIVNGSQLRADAANAYLERIPAHSFSSELFSILCTPSSMFSGTAIANYLLAFKDRETVKAQNVRTLFEHASGNALTSSYQINHLGNSISCNILQAYTLITTDCPATALEVADYLVSVHKLKINADMYVSGIGMKLKKYAATNRENLSETADAICERFKVYSMIF